MGRTGKKHGVQRQRAELLIRQEIYLHVQKGRTWLTVAVGSQKPADREPEPARRLAEQLAKKL